MALRTSIRVVLRRGAGSHSKLEVGWTESAWNFRSSAGISVRLTGAPSPPTFPGALLPPFTSANGWRVARGGVPQRVGKVDERGEQTDPGQPRPRLRKHAVSPGDLRHPTEGTMVAVGQMIYSSHGEHDMSRSSKSASGRRQGSGVDNVSKAARDNRARQLDPQHDTYWRGRGYEGRPDPSPDGTSKKSR